MQVTVKLFASLAESIGWREKSLEAPQDAQVLAVWQVATGAAGLPPRVLCARNMRYCTPETAVKEGDEIAFFPPVTGG